LELLERLELFQSFQKFQQFQKTRSSMKMPMRSVRQWHGHENMRLIAKHARDMPFAGGIVGQHHIAVNSS